jgi:hypothetical protein
MKISFEVPDEIAAKFMRSVPPGQRSSVVVRFMIAEVRKRYNRDLAAARKANDLAKKHQTISRWEQFDDSE